VDCIRLVLGAGSPDGPDATAVEAGLGQWMRLG
jgi:hypothetical protein